MSEGGNQFGNLGAMLGGQSQDGGQGNASLLQQQQQQAALMAMAGGGSGNAGGSYDAAGASREALMNLLARQGFGGAAGGAQAGEGMNQGGAGAGGGGAAASGQGLGNGQQGLGGLQGMGGGGQDQSGMMVGMNMNPMMGGFGPGMGGFGSLMGGMNPGVMGMGGLGASNLFMNNMGSQGGSGEEKDASGVGNAQSMQNNMAQQMQQQMLLQQMLAQQNPGMWGQFGAMGASSPDAMMSGGAGYLSMLGAGQPGANPAAMASRDGSTGGDGAVLQGAGLADFSKGGKKARPKKPKNKPKRPLSAYNIFFKDERAKILADIPDKKDGEDDEEDEDGVKKEDGDDKKEDGEGADGKKTAGKKRKRVPHGKIGFESLAKIVGQRWKELPADELAIYKKRAEEDMKRYRREMETYVQKQREGLEQSREHLEKLVDEETKKRYFGDGNV